MWTDPDDEALRELLIRARRIAVVGLSPNTWRDSHRVAAYLQGRGYEIVPVYPRGEQILGAAVYRSLAQIEEPVDLVDVFRRSEHLREVVDDALAAKAPALWFQLGCVDEASARRARDAGMTVVVDRCLMVDHARLLGRGWQRTGA